jgi:hypothetical protein
MNLQETVKFTGDVSVVLYNPATGEVKGRREIKQYIASRMVGTAANVMSHMALGAGTTAAAVGDTALGSELGRVALTTGTATGAVVTYTATFGAGTATGAVTEAGVLNASSAGTLLCRTVFAVVNKGADDAMAITWAITAS